MPNPKTSNSKLKRAIIKSMPIIVNQRQKKYRISNIEHRTFNIDYHGKNVPYRYMSDILLNKVLIISDLILGK